MKHMMLSMPKMDTLLICSGEDEEEYDKYGASFPQNEGKDMLRFCLVCFCGIICSLGKVGFVWILPD